MISIPQPAMAMNSHNVPLPHYRMANTWNVKADVGPAHLLGWAADVFKDFQKKNPDRTFFDLIINCHGKVGASGKGGYGLSIGTGIRRDDVVHFEKIAPYVNNIFLVACQAGFIDAAGGAGDGNLLCSAIAKAAQAHVWASTADQYGPPWVPFGCIDDMDGTVLVYGPDGGVEKVYNFDYP